MKKSKLFLISAAMTVNLNVFAQSSFLFVAGKLNTGGNYGYSTIQNLSDHSYLVSGTTNNYGSGENDIILIKVDSAGNYLWAKSIGGAADEGGGFIKNSKDGGYFLAGSTKTWGSSGTSDIMLMKFDASNNVQWTQVAGASAYEISINSLDIASDSSLYVGGADVSTGNYFGYISRFTASGTHLWSRVLAPDTTSPVPHSDYYQNYAATSDSGVIAVGWSWSYRMTGAGNRQCIVVKFNSSGNIDWAKIIGIGSSGLGGFDANCITPVSGGGYIVSGDIGVNGVILVKIDATGNLLWAKQTNEGGASSRIIQTSDGGFLIAGKSAYWHPNNKLTRTQWKFDGSGNILWTMSDISIADGHPNPFEWDYQPIETDDGYVTAGFSHRHTDAYAETQLSLQKFKYDGTTCEESSVIATVSNITDILVNDITTRVQTYLQTPAVITSNPSVIPTFITPDYWTECSVLSINNHVINDSKANIYINSNTLYISANTAINQTLITDMSGKQLMKTVGKGQSDIQINIESLHSGIYIATIITEKGKIIRNKFLRL